MSDINKTTISQLLSHLQEMRETIPVNFQLKLDLKKELEKRIEQMDAAKRAPLSAKPVLRPSIYFFKIIGLGLAAAILLLFVWFNAGTKWSVDPITLTSMQPQLSTLSPDGQQIALIENGTIKVIHSKSQSIQYTYDLPGKGTTGTYWQDAIWSPSGNMLAMVQRQVDKSRIWILYLGVGSSRLILETDKSLYDNLSWSPDMEFLLAAKRENGFDNLIKINVANSSEETWSEGTRPAWSPDGKWIAFSRNDDIWLSPADGTEHKLVGPGNKPYWTKDNVLHYFTDQPSQLLSSSAAITDITLSNIEWKRTQWPIKGENYRLNVSKDGQWMLLEEKKSDGTVKLYKLN